MIMFPPLIPLVNRAKKFNLVKWAAFLPIALSLAFAIKVIIQAPLSPDSWLHMAVGRFIVEEKRIPLHQDISFRPVPHWSG